MQRKKNQTNKKKKERRDLMQSMYIELILVLVLVQLLLPSNNICMFACGDFNRRCYGPFIS